MKLNKLVYLVLFIAILGTTSVATAATEATWNDITFTVPDGFNTGTPGADKIAMVNGGDRILLETFDEDGLNELLEESELKGNDTFNMNDLEVTQLQFKTDSGTKLLFLFSQDDNDYQISYFVPDPVDEDEEDEDDADADDESEDEESDDDESEDDKEADEDEEDDADDEEADDESEDEEDEDSEDEDDEETEIDFDINDPENPVNVLINSLKF